MYKKKILYSLFTVPVAVTTFNIYDWHRRRNKEKAIEIELRKDRLLKEPSRLSLNSIDNASQLPWANLDIQEFNDKWAYQPFELIGKFDHGKEVLVKRVRDGEAGFQIITPFYCYRNSTGESMPLLVDRGWIPVDRSRVKLHHSTATGVVRLVGSFYKGDSSNKYSKKNYIKTEEFNTLKPDELAIFMQLPNCDVASNALFKSIEFENDNKNIVPRVTNLSELSKFTISPEKHSEYSKLWYLVTFANVFSNMFVWLYL